MNHLSTSRKEKTKKNMGKTNQKMSRYKMKLNLSQIKARVFQKIQKWIETNSRMKCSPKTSDTPSVCATSMNFTYTASWRSRKIAPS